jgi:hypothetical protein
MLHYDGGVGPIQFRYLIGARCDKNVIIACVIVMMNMKKWNVSLLQGRAILVTETCQWRIKKPGCAFVLYIIVAIPYQK